MKGSKEGRERTFKADLEGTGFAERIAKVQDTEGRKCLRRIAEALCEVDDVESRIYNAMEDYYSDSLDGAETLCDSAVGEQVEALRAAITELMENVLCELSDIEEDDTQGNDNY